MSLRSVWVVALAAGCDPGPANVEACERYLESLQCGKNDLTTVYPTGFCAGFEDVRCEMAPWFDCLVEGSECHRGVYTPAEGCEVPTCE